MARGMHEKQVLPLDKSVSSETSSPPSTLSCIPQLDGASEAATDRDQAFVYLEFNDRGNNAEAGALYSDALRRKIDWRIVPIMFACYTMQFLDKVLLNVSS